MKNWQHPIFTFLVLAFALVSAATLQAAAVNAQVASVSGSVEYAKPGSLSFAPLKARQILPIGSTVRTGDDGIAIIVTTPDCAVQLGNNSTLKINELAFSKSGSTVTERTANLELKDGVVSALVNHDTPKVTNFKIQTPQGAAAARGTFYAVLVYHGKTYVGVKEGRVAASSAGQ